MSFDNWRVPTRRNTASGGPIPLGIYRRLHTALAGPSRAPGWPYPVILIDGPSGAGKTTCAAALVAHAARSGQRLQCVHLDSIYPGWHGLAAASAIVDQLLTDWRAGGHASRSNGGASENRVPRPRMWKKEGCAYVRTWDWAAGMPGRALRITPGPLLIEGCGAITRLSSRCAALSIWVDMRPTCDDAGVGASETGETQRRHRALQRDGDIYTPWWDSWAAQEQAHWRRNHPSTRADLRIWT